MRNNCTNCGGKIYFSPKNKGNVCERCGSVFPIEYNYEFSKNDFEKNQIQLKEFANEMKNIKCQSCGANIVLSKYKLQANCPYCGSSSLVTSKTEKLMFIDSIIPFEFSKSEAINKFKTILKKRFYANKKLFNQLNEEDVNGAYCNTFIFDFETSSDYSGVFSYTKVYEDNDGNKHTKTYYKNVQGVFDKNYKNITVEANSNLEQKELLSIMPYNYSNAVKFDEEFMQGYILEYQDKMFNECVEVAQRIVKRDIEKSLLAKYNCDKIETLNLSTKYLDKKYNYCLLPIYFISKKVKDKTYKTVMNGQTGKVGKIPSDKLRVLLTIFLSILGVVGVILLFIFLGK